MIPIFRTSAPCPAGLKKAFFSPMLRKAASFVYALFLPHYRVYTEEQFQGLEADLPRVNYNCDEIRKSFHDSPLRCCDLPLATTVQVDFLYGGRGVRVNRDAVCPKCHKTCHDEMRLRDGCIMKQDPQGRWLLAFLEEPLIVKWCRSLWS